MKQFMTKCTIGVLLTIITYMCVNSWYRSTHPNAFVWCDEDRDEAKWIASSKSWLDKKACRWLGICGGLHMMFGYSPSGEIQNSTLANDTQHWGWESQWHDDEMHFLPVIDDEQSPLPGDKDQSREIPSYVMEYAPLIHLYSGEEFWPCDIAEHLFHTTPMLNYTPIQSDDTYTTLTNLDKLNQYEHGRNVFLTSKDDVSLRPDWLEGTKNIPEKVSAEHASIEDNDGWVHRPARTLSQGLRDAATALGKDFDPSNVDDVDVSDATADETVQMLRKEAETLLEEELRGDSARSESHPYAQKIKGGRSAAPAILIVVPKPDGIVDAFWFCFYSFNQGNSVLGIRFGDHIGDWEHTAVRFKDGIPLAVYFSEHNFGSAYSYEAVEKLGKRPIIYSAYGTHAMYSTPGLQPYILPFGLLHDTTDRGPLWDPALNHHSYTYNTNSDELLASELTPHSPTGWFHFAGHWGDKFYQLGDQRQYRLIGQYHYVNGPLGPKFKDLGRKEICGLPEGVPCVIKHWLGGGGRVARLPNNGEEADEWSKAYKEGIQLELR